MCIPLIPISIALLIWANVAITRSFQRRHAGQGWWSALAIAWLAGAALGFWLGVCFEYQLTPTLRVAGAPVPGAFFHLEGPPGQEVWIDFITPAPLLAIGSNIVIMSLLAACLVGIGFQMRRRTS